ncbi:MAG: AMP-binding protein [Acidobacteriota bacterium]|nr:AMP-binding protein [Acidobacteriota bacterium]MDE3044145.1 AMP-binding protein [Acidobacteriota bacterium]
MVSVDESSDVASLSVFFEAHGDAPNATYVRDARRDLSLHYGELAGVLASRRAQFEAWGLGPGDRVGLLFASPFSFVGWFLAGLHAGLWVAPLDPTNATNSPEATDHRAHALSLNAIVSDLPGPRHSATRWWRAPSSDVAASLANEEVGGGVLLASSGSTGTPKVMALSKFQLLTNARLIARNHEFTRRDRGFNALPWWHVNAEVVGFLATLCAGATLVVDERFHRTKFWDVVRDHEVTWINAVPAMIARLLPLHDGERVPDSLRFVRSASAPLAPRLLQAFEAATGVDVIESYGMTEAASQICANPAGGARVIGSVGRPVGVDVRVVRPPDDVATGFDGVEVGLVEIKGPTVITNYESPGYDDRFDDHGWLRTGDVGYFDEDGFLFLVGRSDDVINRGGEKVYPQEIENVLTGVRGVERVVVIGEADDVFGQVPVAYVEVPADVVRDDLELDAVLSSLRGALTSQLTKAYRPALLKIVEEIPTAATGKVRKGLVRSGDVRVVRVEHL